MNPYQERTKNLSQRRERLSAIHGESILQSAPQARLNFLKLIHFPVPKIREIKKGAEAPHFT